MRIRTQLIAVALLLSGVLVGATGCDVFDSAAGPDQDFDLTTDARSYSLSDSAVVQINGVNVGSDALYQEWPTGDTVLEKERAGAWEEIGAWYAVAAVVPSPRAVAPGDSAIAPDLPVQSEQIDGPGRYRIKTKIYESEALETMLPLEERVSNVFEVTE
jgi:hypothetical protein